MYDLLSYPRKRADNEEEKNIKRLESDLPELFREVRKRELLSRFETPEPKEFVEWLRKNNRIYREEEKNDLEMPS